MTVGDGEESVLGKRGRGEKKGEQKRGNGQLKSWQPHLVKITATGK